MCSRLCDLSEFHEFLPGPEFHSTILHVISAWWYNLFIWFVFNHTLLAVIDLARSLWTCILQLPALASLSQCASDDMADPSWDFFPVRNTCRSQGTAKATCERLKIGYFERPMQDIMSHGKLIHNKWWRTAIPLTRLHPDTTESAFHHSNKFLQWQDWWHAQIAG